MNYGDTMYPATHLHPTRRQALGQTGLVVTLFILFLGLAGFTTFLFIQQGSSAEALNKKIEEQDRNLRNAKNMIDELTEKIRSQKNMLNDQEDALSRLRNESATTKTALAQVQTGIESNIGSMQKNIDTFKSDAKQQIESFLGSSSKMEVKLNELVNEIRKIQTPAGAIPVVTIKMEPAATETAKDKKQ
ncbi:MAG: hypothetical protein V2A70_03190 [Candidatus Omnitrophota bacterium]